MAKRKADDAFSSDTAQVPSRNGNHNTPSQRTIPGSGKGSASNLRQKADVLLKQRQQLPIWPHADEIRSKAHDNDVLVLVGETGSGKSTQIPQFLYQEKWCRVTASSNTGKVGGRIAISQPRRVAAISLATRVASEIGTPLGSSSPASTVGYSVRFDNNVSLATKIRFLTDGMLLQELLRDPWLKEYSCVIVDEVHERGVNVDLVLGFLRRILDVGRNGGNDDGRGGVPLKVVVMSATADMESITEFFRGQNNTSPTEENDGEWNGFSDDDLGPQHSTLKSQISITSCYIQGRQYPVTTIYTPQPVANLLDTAMDRIVNIHQHTPLPGDILVFLSGQEMIENLESLCHTYASTLNQPPAPNTKRLHDQKLPNLQILPLFASLPTHLQSRIFQPTPPFTRRIILATNIAETSITVPGIRHVIDTGKHKCRLFRPGLNLDTLLSNPISQSMAKQRAGRAGREAPGTCYRLYTEKDYWTLEKDTKPEILSTDLSFLVLTLKAHDVDNVLDFPLLTKPPRRSLEAALEGLLNLGALEEDDGRITEVGRKMAGLPVRPDLARCLLEGSRYGGDVLEGVVDIVSALSLEEGIFLPVHGKRIEDGKKSTEQLLVSGKGREAEAAEDSDEETSPVETARRQLLSRHSDHVTLMNAIRTYSSPSTHDRRQWCDAHGVSHRAMSRIMDVRKQLQQMMNSPRFQLASTKDMKAIAEGDGAVGELARREAILKSLVSGLWKNVAVLSSMAPKTQQQAQNPNQRAPYTTLVANQPIHIHPNSVLFTQMGSVGGSKRENGGKGKRGGRPASTSNMPNAIIFTDLIYTTKPYARNVSAVELNWVAEIAKIS